MDSLDSGIKKCFI